eukprot:Hpha_TRINITY_DN4055_c0_g1::TRINITY_DN4055_c0_g1_i1::g.63608::m.63608/K13711/PI4K2; phosphatidylinositol 4-kinase type 2
MPDSVNAEGAGKDDHLLHEPLLAAGDGAGADHPAVRTPSESGLDPSAPAQGVSLQTAESVLHGDAQVVPVERAQTDNSVLLADAREEQVEEAPRSRLGRLRGRSTVLTCVRVGELDSPPPGTPSYDVVQQMGITVAQIQAGIAAGCLPELVVAGSSGSYWIRNAESRTLGIFKPKSEEPYGPANPKWAKFFQRVLCPCCFGRSCLLPNTGYLSEGGAYAVDCALELGVVPVTLILNMRASSFNYSKVQRLLPHLPQKIGSFQVFMQSNGTGNDVKWDEMSKQGQMSFLEEFQKLVVLDYIIRNTDRGLDNWLVQRNRAQNQEGVLEEHWHIHAIDNGLAFPFKHPDNWRTYPPSWATHKLGRIPFLPRVREHVLRKIGESFMSKVEKRLRDIFQHDHAFSETRFQGQMGVMRGQRQNLYDLLNRPVESERTPEALFAMHPLFIVKQKTHRGHQLVGWETHLPCFTCC